YLAGARRESRYTVVRIRQSDDGSRRNVGRIEINVPIDGALRSNRWSDSVKGDGASGGDGDGAEGKASGVFHRGRDDGDVCRRGARASGYSVCRNSRGSGINPVRIDRAASRGVAAH